MLQEIVGRIERVVSCCGVVEQQREAYVAIVSDTRLITTAQTTVYGVILMSRKPSDRKAAVATSAYNHGKCVYRILL